MAQYISRAGRPMTQEAWAAAFNDEDNRHVRRDRGCDGKSIIETCWVGWCFDWESPPRPYLVSRIVSGGLSEDTWHVTKAEALARHNALVGGCGQ